MGLSSLSLAREPGGPSPLTRPKLEDIPESCIAPRTWTHRRSHSSTGLSELPRLAFQIAPHLSLYSLQLPDHGAGDKGEKDIYGRLCRPSFFDGGAKEVWIDTRTGWECLAISSKALAITGIDDRRYWNHIPTDGSRFQTVAYLNLIWWLEVDGEVEFQFPTGTYSLFFRLQLGKTGKRMGRQLCNSENVHGWDLRPVQLQLTTEDGQHAVNRCMLENLGNWEHYHVGDFVVDDHNMSTKLKFSMTQIDCTHTKGGLSVDSVLICLNTCNAAKASGRTSFLHWWRNQLFILGG